MNQKFFDPIEDDPVIRFEKKKAQKNETLGEKLINEMYANTSGSGHDKGYGIIEPISAGQLKLKNKSA